MELNEKQTQKTLIKNADYFKFRGITEMMPDWFMDVLTKHNNMIRVDSKCVHLDTDEIPFGCYLVKRDGNISILTKEQFEDRYEVADRIRPLSSLCTQTVTAKDEVVIKSCGICTQLFINGIEEKWVQKIKFKHSVKEFATLEIKRIV